MDSSTSSHSFKRQHRASEHVRDASQSPCARYSVLLWLWLIPSSRLLLARSRLLYRDKLRLRCHDTGREKERSLLDNGKRWFCVTDGGFPTRMQNLWVQIGRPTTIAIQSVALCIQLDMPNDSLLIPSALLLDLHRPPILQQGSILA